MAAPDLNEIRDTFAFLDDWEDKYRFVIDLGKTLPALSDELKDEDHLVRGCQSQVWLHHATAADGTLDFRMDSDAHIVRGLIAIVLAACNHRTPEDVLAFDMESLFEEMQLLTHLSPTRGNGLVAMIGRVRDVARVESAAV